MLELIFILKIITLSIYLIIIRGTLPRYRVDQFLKSSWKDWIFLLLFFTLLLVCTCALILS